MGEVGSPVSGENDDEQRVDDSVDAPDVDPAAAVDVEVPETRRAARDQAKRERSNARWKKAAPWVYAGGGVLVVLLALLGWAGSRVFVAYQEVSAVQSEAKTLASDAAKLRFDAVEAGLESITGHVERARAVTEEPIWGVMSGIPWLGKNLVVVKEIVGVLDDTIVLAHPLVEWAAGFDFSTFSVSDGVLPVAEIKDVLGELQEFGTSLPALVERAQAIDASGTVGPVQSGARLVTKTLERASDALDSVREIAGVLPMLLGEDEPQTYVIAFFNNAEPTALGGSALSFVQMTMDSGRLSFDATLGASTAEFIASPGQSVISVPDGVSDLFTFGQHIGNSTFRPSFPSAAEQISAHFLRSRGVEVDQVVGMDALSLKSILDATGSVTVSTGDVIDADNVIDFLFNEVYIKYQNGAQQDVIYGEVVSEMFARIISGKVDLMKLGRNLLADMETGSFSLWSRDPAVQAAFVGLGAGNDLPVSDDDTERIGVYFNFYVGTKLGYYLESSLDVGSAVCGADRVDQRRLTLTVTNTLPPDQVQAVGRYVRGATNPDGVLSVMAFIYMPPGSTLLGSTLDGATIGTMWLHDVDYPVARFPLALAAGQTKTLVFDYQAPLPGGRDIEVDLTPTIQGTEVTTSTVDCQEVGARSPYSTPSPVDPSAIVPNPY